MIESAKLIHGEFFVMQVYLRTLLYKERLLAISLVPRSLFSGRCKQNPGDTP
ncbi:hypothetical protein Desdi_3371 [Desulfitobacterium dichloroeliminans LMG P-21439]|uniref:Uncharacterized protein n=1 Tax=Desulfitobacterium dichloroeliminans (strain LMG P-21439 / DCA1) TaxID=871963 RepID=L0FC13_DESDL|nr:hypothetical protein Desdi_3371 [Desulfitobacterium dichloroeliminans LMG P-21439]